MVLAHELAHIRRGDFANRLAGHFCVIVHFYHPIAHWLMARLQARAGACRGQLGHSAGRRPHEVSDHARRGSLCVTTLAGPVGSIVPYWHSIVCSSGGLTCLIAIRPLDGQRNRAPGALDG